MSGTESSIIACMKISEILIKDEPSVSFEVFPPKRDAPMEPVLETVRQLSEEKMTMIVVTHEMGFAKEASDKVLFMAERQIIAAGTTQEIFENPKDERVKSFISSIL